MEDRSHDASVEELVEGAIVDSMSEHYTQRNTRHRVFTGILQCLVLSVLTAVVVLVVYRGFPEFFETFEAWAETANASGPTGMLLFTVAMSLFMLIPGVPGSLLCVTCGAVFPFWKALLVAVAGQHWGSCMSFLIARRLLGSHFKGMVNKRPTLQAFSAAARIEQWKVTFLSRFVVMPVQLKNYGFGVLPVSFKCFVLMSLLGDFQSILFGVYIGSISKQIASTAKGSSSHISTGLDGTGSISTNPHQTSAPVQGTLTIINLVIAVLMTSTASYVARRAYLRMLVEIKPDVTIGETSHGSGEDELESLVPKRSASSRSRKRFSQVSNEGLELLVLDSPVPLNGTHGSP